MKKLFYLLAFISFILIAVWINKDLIINDHKSQEFLQENQILLFKAIKAKDVDRVRELAPITDLNTLNNKNHSLLFVVVKDAVKRSNWNYSELSSETEIKPEYVEIIKILVENGADPTIRERVAVDINSIITFAIQPKVPDQILDAILAGGFDPNYVYGINDRLISKLIYERTFTKLKLLVDKYNAKIDNPVPDNYLYSPIISATIHDSPSVVFYLLEKGEDPFQYGLAYFVFNSIKNTAEWMEEHGGRYPEHYPKSEKKLIEYLKLKQLLIKEGVPWPPDQLEINKQLKDWEENHQKNIEFVEQISEKYAAEVGNSK